MFHTNGNRRPNAICSVVIHHHGKTINQAARLIFDMVYAVNNSREIQLVNQTTFEKGLRPIQMGSVVEWKSTEKTFERNDHYVLFNIAQVNKTERKALMTIYIVPKAMFIDTPRQKEMSFEATIDPAFVIEDTRASTGPVINVFTTEDIDGVHYFKSKTEAMYYVHNDEKRLSTVDCIRVGDEYFEIKTKLPAMKEVDVNEFKLFSFDSSKQKSKTKTYFNPKIQNDGSSVYYSHDIDSFADGFYKVSGHLNGGIFIETIASLIKEPVRNAYFFKVNTPEYRKVAELKGIITSLK